MTTTRTVEHRHVDQTDMIYDPVGAAPDDSTPEAALLWAVSSGLFVARCIVTNEIVNYTTIEEGPEPCTEAHWRHVSTYIDTEQPERKAIAS